MLDVEFYKDKAAEWRWRVTFTWPAETLRGTEILADSGDGYIYQHDCEADFVRLVNGLRGEANTVVVDDAGGKVVGSLAALVDKAARSNQR